MRVLLVIFLFFANFPRVVISDFILDSDLSKALASLYKLNPKIKYEREILMSKDELLPQALANFRPEISGYYEKGKIDTNSTGFNITSDGIRTETNKSIRITQRVFDGQSSLSEMVSKKMKYYLKDFLKSIEQEVFLEAIKIYADLATEIQI